MAVFVDVTDISKTLAILGGYIIVVGLVSYLVKNRLFISESILAVGLGIAIGPVALNWVNPHEWVDYDEERYRYLTLQITRIIIGIQVLFAGIDLPKAYLKKEWKSLATLLGPAMLSGWFISGLLIWGLIPGLTYLESLVIASCVTPTDPVLANAICKGRFAEEHVPPNVRNLIIAESGANDGLGYPFLFIGLFLIRRHTEGFPDSLGWAIGHWIYETLIYQVLLAVVIGSVLGYVFRKALRWAERKQLVDHDSFLAFGMAAAFFTLGVCGLLGTDDILACFILGNSFSWDDWFRVETEEHAVQDVIDLLLNSSVFIYIGTILPWSQFDRYFGIYTWRLILLGITIIALRRPPWVTALTRLMPALKGYGEGAFTGFFGCIGVSAVFYIQVALENIPEERTQLRAVIEPVVLFLVLTSVLIHGITIPLGKGFHHTLTITKTRSTSSGAVLRLPQAPMELPTNPQGDDTGILASGRSTGTKLTDRSRTNTVDLTLTFQEPVLDRGAVLRSNV